MSSLANSVAQNAFNKMLAETTVGFNPSFDNKIQTAVHSNGGKVYIAIRILVSMYEAAF